MITATQYRAKAAEYTELLKAAHLPAETREFRKREQSYLTLAENEEWMADNRAKIDSRGADENWYGEAILAQQGSIRSDARGPTSQRSRLPPQRGRMHPRSDQCSNPLANAQ